MLSLSQRIYFDKLITRLIYYISWAFVILVGVIIFELLGKTQEVVQVGSSLGTLVIDFIRNNFEFVWITSVIFIVLIGVLFAGYNYELVKDIYLNRISNKEGFVSPISSKLILDKLEIYISRMKFLKDYAKDYGLAESSLIEQMREANRIKQFVISRRNKDFYNIDEVYDLSQPLLNLYYKQNKTAQELAKDLGISIVVPNAKLEDEYRTRYEKIHTTGINRDLYKGSGGGSYGDLKNF